MRGKVVAVVAMVLLRMVVQAQDFKVEYDKKADLTRYKSFSFGEGEIITPKDLRRVPDSTIHRWIRKAVTEELTKKGLLLVDSLSDLTVSYVVGSQVRSDAHNVGPLGLTPGTTEQTYVRDYHQGSLVVDLNESGNRKFVWRVSASTSTVSEDAQQVINQIVFKGFKKFPKRPKEK